MSGKLYVAAQTDDEAGNSNNIANAVNHDLETLTTDQDLYYLDLQANGSNITLSSGDTCRISWYPDTNEGAGTFYVHGILLVRQ